MNDTCVLAGLGFWPGSLEEEGSGLRLGERLGGVLSGEAGGKQANVRV